MASQVFKNGKYFTGSSVSGTLDLSTTRAGYRFPDYQEAIRLAVSATTDFSDVLITTKFLNYERPWAYGEWKDGSSSWAQNVVCDNGYFLGLLPPGAWPAGLQSSLYSTAQSEASSRVYEKLAVHFEGLTVLGELRETLHMIKHPAESLRRGIDVYARWARGIRRSCRRLPRKIRHATYAKAVGDTWLESVWGWMPLINDVQSGLDAYRDLVDRPAVERFSARGSADATFRRERTQYGYWWIHYPFYAQSKGTVTVQYKGAAKSNLETNFGLSNFGFSFAEFVPAAWELMPYSWLIDYFGNIGDVLSSWATAQRVEFVFCQRTRRDIREDFQWSEFHPIDAYAYKFTNWDKGNYRVFTQHKTVQRESVSDVPLPMLTTTWNFNLRRGLNIGALLASRNADRIWKP